MLMQESRRGAPPRAAGLRKQALVDHQAGIDIIS
jgi:hypothetical protein